LCHVPALPMCPAGTCLLWEVVCLRSHQLPAPSIRAIRPEEFVGWELSAWQRKL